MSRAASVLATITQGQLAHLPRFESSQSGPVYARLTALDNLSLFRNRSSPIATRLLDALTYLEGLNRITKLYVTALLQDQVAGIDLLELIGALLHANLLMNELAEEFLPTLDTEDPAYGVRMDGVRRMKAGTAMTIAGALQTLTERSTYTLDERRRFVEHLRDTLPGIVPYLTEVARIETLARLESMCKDQEVSDLRSDLERLHDEVKAAVRNIKGQ